MNACCFSGFIAFSSMPQLAQKIKVFFALAPLYTFHHAKGPVLKIAFLPDIVLKVCKYIYIYFCVCVITLSTPNELMKFKNFQQGKSHSLCCSGSPAIVHWAHACTRSWRGVWRDERRSQKTGMSLSFQFRMATFHSKTSLPVHHYCFLNRGDRPVTWVWLSHADHS